jgi:hypothetical protein
MEPERSLEQRLADVEALLRTILVRLEEVEVRSPTPEPARQRRPQHHRLLGRDPR